jgi:hypothetical protein
VLTAVADAAATIAAVSGLFADPALARTAGANAASWVREHYRWEAVYRRYDEETPASLTRLLAHTSQPV